MKVIVKEIRIKGSPSLTIYDSWFIDFNLACFLQTFSSSAFIIRGKASQSRVKIDDLVKSHKSACFWTA
ncbi:MAG: hypothetical protein QMD32_07685, partial [Smithellaceae bacterium]|nr:hypothetical protein [Smithellaceae bacterium]